MKAVRILFFGPPYRTVKAITEVLFSPLCIAMPRSLYFTAVVSSFFFSTPNLWRHWADLNQTWIRINLWLLFEKPGPISPRHLPPRAGGKKLLLGILGLTLNFDRTVSATEDDINNWKEICQSAGTPLHGPQIWWTLVQKRLRTVGEFVPTT